MFFKIPQTLSNSRILRFHGEDYAQQARNAALAMKSEIMKLIGKITLQ